MLTYQDFLLIFRLYNLKYIYIYIYIKLVMDFINLENTSESKNI